MRHIMEDMLSTLVTCSVPVVGFIKSLKEKQKKRQERSIKERRDRLNALNLLQKVCWHCNKRKKPINKPSKDGKHYLCVGCHKKESINPY